MLSEAQLHRVQYLLNLDYIVDTGSPDDDEVTRRQFDAALEQMGTEELHQYAGNYDCDCGSEGLRQVVRHPHCDRGTALMIFWRLGPGWYFQHPNPDRVPYHERNWYDLLMEIQDKYVRGGFSKSEIAVDPRHMDGEDRTREYQNEGGVKRVAPVLFTPSPGHIVELLQL